MLLLITNSKKILNYGINKHLHSRFLMRENVHKHFQNFQINNILNLAIFFTKLKHQNLHMVIYKESSFCQQLVFTANPPLSIMFRKYW